MVDGAFSSKLLTAIGRFAARPLCLSLLKCRDARVLEGTLFCICALAERDWPRGRLLLPDGSEHSNFV